MGYVNQDECICCQITKEYKEGLEKEDEKQKDLTFKQLYVCGIVAGEIQPQMSTPIPLCDDCSILLHIARDMIGKHQLGHKHNENCEHCKKVH